MQDTPKDEEGRAALLGLSVENFRRLIAVRKTFMHARPANSRAHSGNGDPQVTGPALELAKRQLEKLNAELFGEPQHRVLSEIAKERETTTRTLPEEVEMEPMSEDQAVAMFMGSLRKATPGMAGAADVYREEMLAAGASEIEISEEMLRFARTEFDASLATQMTVEDAIHLLRTW